MLGRRACVLGLQEALQLPITGLLQSEAQLMGTPELAKMLSKDSTTSRAMDQAPVATHLDMTSKTMVARDEPADNRFEENLSQIVIALWSNSSLR